MRKHGGTVRKVKGVRAWYVDYRDAKGNRTRKRFASKSEAQDYLAQKRGEGFFAAADVTLGAYVNAFIEGKLAQRAKPRYLESLTWAFESHVTPFFGEQTRLADIDKLAVVRFRDTLLSRRSQVSGDLLKPKTVRGLLAFLNMLMNRAVDDEVLRSNPATRVRLPRRINGEVRAVDRSKAFTPEQLAAFLAAAGEVKPRLLLMYRIQAATGLRPGEARGLKWGDLIPEGLHVSRTVNADGEEGTPKNGKSRVVELSASLRSAIEVAGRAAHERALRHGLRRSEWMFPSLQGNPINEGNLSRYFKLCLQAAGLAKHFSPHSLRHTFASIAISKGVSIAWVSEQLGHADVTTTYKVYGNWLRKEAPGASDLMAGFVGILGN